jgi:hypothetical protein
MEYKEDTDEIVPMPDEYGFPTEATPIPEPSELEREALKGDPSSLQLEKGANGHDDTRILNENGELSKSVYEEPEVYEEKPSEESERDTDFAKALDAVVTISGKGSRRLSSGEPSREYKGNHIYVWWKQDPSTKKWEMIGSYPKPLWVKLDLGDMANIDAEKIVYGGREFHKFAYFEYDYKCTTKPRKGCKLDDHLRVLKYSITPNGEEEIVNRILCEHQMKKLERKKQEKIKKEKEEREKRRKQESNQLTKVNPTPRFPQKQ